HALDRLLCAVHGRFVLVTGVSDLPNGRLVARTLPMAGCAPAHRIEARLVLPVVVAAAKHEARLHPYDLRPYPEAADLQALRDHARVHAGMPDIGDIAGKQRPGLAPVGTVVVRHLSNARRGRYPSFIAPGRIVLDAIGRVR